MPRAVRVAKEKETNNAAQAARGTSTASERQARESASRVLKYIDDFRSASDIKALHEEGYEIDYDRLVGVGTNSAVFLAHSTNAPPPPLDRNGQKPLYTPGYDIAAKVVAKKWISTKRPLKTRTGNLKLALALGQTKPDNNILKVIDVFKTQERIFIFMQYCAYGNVISFIRRNGQVPGKLAQKWSIQMASALCFLHKFHVAHRNYKLENVLVDENLNAKLTGFGLSKFCFDLQSKQIIMSRTICGSEPYLAPEMLKESAERLYDPQQADVWAFGVGVFLCITRRYPFEADNLRALKADQMAHRYLERDTKKRLRSGPRDLLNVVFTIDPNQRPSMQDLCNQCPWLAGASVAAVKVVNQRQVAGAHHHVRSPPPQRQHDPHAAQQQRPAQGSAQHPQASAAPTSPPGPEASAMQADNEPVPEQLLTSVTPVAFQPNDALPAPQNTRHAPQLFEKSRMD